MKMNELKLVYFSPTGTTRKVIMEAARSIDLKSTSHDFSVYKEKKPVLKFAENDFALFGIPVYYGRVPALFTEYLKGITGNGTPAALIATYGCRDYEDALLELKDIVEKNGFKVIAAAAFPAEHSLDPTIGARRPNKADLKTIAEYNGNILTIHQTIPINGVASLTLSVDVLPTTGDTSAMLANIEGLNGIHYLKILGRE